MPKACIARGYVGESFSHNKFVPSSRSTGYNNGESLLPSSTCIARDKQPMTPETETSSTEVSPGVSPGRSPMKEPETEPEIEREEALADEKEEEQSPKPAAGDAGVADSPDAESRSGKARACPAVEESAGPQPDEDYSEYSDLIVPNVGPAIVGQEAPTGLGIVLESMAKLAPSDGARTAFHATKSCPISIGDYVKRLRRFFACSVECYVLALVYIDRAIKREPRLVPDSRSVHRLALCSLLLAAKFQDDIFYSNKFYAQVGGVTLKEINALEVVMLRILDHRLTVEMEEFTIYHEMVTKAYTATAQQKMA